MRAVVQRVAKGAVKINGELVGSIGRGLVVLLGVGKEDSEEDVKVLAEKIVNLRIFPDEEGKMNRSLLDVGGEMLVVSQFTLYGDCRKGRRPSFTDAASPKHAEELYEKFVRYVQDKGLGVATGVFGAMMMVEIFNDGPVTFVLDSQVLK